MAKQRQKTRTIAPTPGPPKAQWNFAIYAALVIAVLAVFRHVFGYGFVDLDDLTYVVDNPHVVAGLTLRGIRWAFAQSYEGYWAPLTWLSYMVDAQLFGLGAAGFHATNVVLHAVSACLLFAGLKRMTGARLGSAFVAAIFAMHPLHVESVAWIAERKDVLSTFFYFLAIWAYARYAERPGPGRYLLVVAAFGCGLMSKPMVVTLPVALLLLDVWPLGRLRSAGRSQEAARGTRNAEGTERGTERATRESERGLGLAEALIEKAPLFAMSLVVAVVTVASQRSAGAVVSLDVASPWLRVANALVSCVVYLGNMFWPARLAAMYPYPQAVPAGQTIAAVFVLAGISFAAFRLRRSAPYLLVGWLWYLVTLLPVLGFIQAGPQARADRYTYIAMTGIALPVVWGIATISSRWRYQRVALAGAAILALAIFSALAFQQVDYWRTTETVFRRALAVTSDNAFAHRGLASGLIEAGDTAGAIAELRSALALAPDFADAQSDLGKALLDLKQPEEAAAHLTRAVQLRGDEATYRINLGSALYALGRGEAAAAEYREALRHAPDSSKARSGLGLVLAQQGDVEGARRELNEAIRLTPDYVDAYLNLGTILQRAGLAADAERAFATATRLRPDMADAHIGLGTLLATQGRTNDAIAELSTAVRLVPTDAELRSNLAVMLISAGRTDEGIAQLSEAVRLRPDLPELRSNLDLAVSMRAGASTAAPRPHR